MGRPVKDHAGRPIHPHRVTGASQTGRRARLALVAAALAALAVVAAAAIPARALAADTFTAKPVTAKLSLDQLEKEAAKVRAEMRDLSARLATATKRYDTARARLDVLGAQLSQTRLQLARSQGELDVQRAIVADHAAAMYKSGDFSVLDVLIGSTSFADVESGVDLFGRIMEQAQSAEARLASLARDVAVLAKNVEEHRQEALATEATIADERALVERTIADRKTLLDGLVTRIQKLLAADIPTSLAKAPPGGYTQYTWAKALLGELGMPVSRENLAAIVAWEMAEGGHWHNVAYYNPLNTTQPEPGATSMNSVGVKAYRSWAQGFQATITTLRNGYYGGILAALRRGDDAFAVAAAVAASPWGTGSFSSLL